MSIGRSLFEKRINWKRLIILFLLIDAAILGLACAVLANIENPGVQVVLQFPSPTTTFTPTQTPTPGPTGTPTPWPSPTPTQHLPTATPTRVVEIKNDATATVVAQLKATAQAEEEAEALAQLESWLNPQSRRPDPLVLAHYFAWFDGQGWNDCNMSAGDRPLLPYDSDDPSAIARHIEMAKSIGLNGFTLHWFAPGDPTDRNFDSLLTLALGSDFVATVVYSHHIWHGLPYPTQVDISNALRYVVVEHGAHPNFLRFEGKPVIFFTDIYRVPIAAGQSPQQFWAAVRDDVDPNRNTIWIAEGLDPSYLDVFDGLYIFKITHATAPHDYRKNTQWASWVRAKEEQTGQPKLWIATIMPGWDDRTSTCMPHLDVRAASPLHQLPRANGATFEATFAAAVASNPDWLIVGSFNEWVEGSYIEPSVQYGDYYLQLAADLIQRFKDR